MLPTPNRSSITEYDMRVMDDAEVKQVELRKFGGDPLDDGHGMLQETASDKEVCSFLVTSTFDTQQLLYFDLNWTEKHSYAFKCLYIYIYININIHIYIQNAITLILPLSELWHSSLTFMPN